MTEQDLFYLLALQRVEGVGDIMAKKLLTHCGSRGSFKTKTAQLAIDGVGSMLLRNLKSQAIF
jgi:DNA processing protein